LISRTAAKYTDSAVRCGSTSGSDEEVYFADGSSKYAGRGHSEGERYSKSNAALEALDADVVSEVEFPAVRPRRYVAIISCLAPCENIATPRHCGDKIGFAAH
jgi:hypothetical protein